jgi:predicted O-methyltransferase YrrM
MARVRPHPRTALGAVQIARGALQRFALQKFAELAPFVALVAKTRPRAVVEIGTARGGLLYALCQAAHPEAVIVSVDLPQGAFGTAALTQGEADVFARPGQRVELVAGDSHRPETVARVRELAAPVDLLFIDGDHSYDAVRADYESYAPLVREGGLIAFHDILPHPNAPDCRVDAVWAGLEGRKLEFVDRDDLNPVIGQWGGIGVVVAGRLAA